MVVLVTILGLALVLLGFACLVAPARFRALLALSTQRRWIAVAILLRLFFGVVLMAAATRTALPNFTFALWSVALASGLVAPLLGYDRLVGFTSWWLARSHLLLRTWAILAIALGGLLLYAAVTPPPASAPPPTMHAGANGLRGPHRQDAKDAKTRQGPG
jgi:hypothetical protein